MPTSAIVTAKTGPNSQVTAQQYTGLTGVLFLPDRKIVQLFKGGDTNSPPEQEFDLTGVTTVTCTITAGNYNFVIS